MDADERAHVAVGTVMDGFGHEALARTHLAHNECGERTARNLVNLRVHSLHLAGAPDNVVGLETVLEFQCQALVFGLQKFIFFAGLATELYRRRKHLRDDFKQAQLFGKFVFYRVLHVGTEGANHLMLHDDRHAEERLVLRLAAPRAVQKVRVFRDRGNDNRLARFHHTAGNALAHLVAALARLATAQAFRNFNGDFAGVAVVKRKRRMFHAHRGFYHLQNRVRDALEIERLVQNGTDLVEQFQFLDFGLRRGHYSEKI